MNFYLLHLHNISHDFSRSDQLKMILMPLSQAIEASIKHIKEVELTQTADELYVEAIVDDEVDMIEELLGVAFVVCQCYITEIVSGFKKLHAFADGERLSLTIDGNKEALCKTGSNFVAGAIYTEIQTINAFANYYKHHDEWSADWDELKDTQRITANIIFAAGARQGSTGNMRTGAKSLGCSSYANLDSFIDKISKWKDNLIMVYSAELKRLNKL